MHFARRTTLSAAVAAALAGTALPAAAQHSSPGPTRASVATDGRQADGASVAPALSANGRYIAFVSSAANLVRGDTNGVADVFVHDLRTGRTQRVAEGPATGVALSGDGRDVVLATTAALTRTTTTASTTSTSTTAALTGPSASATVTRTPRPAAG